MTNRRRRANRSTAILHWIFRRGNERLTCRLARGRSFTLSLIPGGHTASAMVETFEDGLRAFHRHAAIASELRQFGWTLASYGR